MISNYVQCIQYTVYKLVNVVIYWINIKSLSYLREIITQILFCCVLARYNNTKL